MCLKHQNLVLKKKKSQQFVKSVTNFLTRKKTNSTNSANKPETPTGTHPAERWTTCISASTSALLTLRTVFGTYFDFFPMEKNKKTNLLN